MKEEILDFIKRRWSGNEELFLNGNCYWFARILQERFPFLDIVYLPVEGHFVAYDKIGEEIFDVTGEVHYNGPRVSLSDLASVDEVWYSRLLKDCKY